MLLNFLLYYCQPEIFFGSRIDLSKLSAITDGLKVAGRDVEQTDKQGIVRAWAGGFDHRDDLV